MWKIIVIITLFIGGCYLVFRIINNILTDRKKTDDKKLSKEVAEEMAKKIVQDARMQRQSRNVDDEPRIK
ncbi:MAG: hypothetical protein GWP19_14380 [Planctomycetia bacterium]|nr:hypothetical protein [Planctomycetia bacterium]